jgi:feruloyl-CoA synthase
MGLAAMRIGMAIVPVSPAWADDPIGHAKLRRIVELVKPRFSWFGGGSKPHPVDECSLLGSEEVACRYPDGAGARMLDEIETRVGADTVAKIMFTSGSTGTPKGVINTHGMLAAQQEQMARLWPFLEDHPPVLCDWLPWNHTSGGNNSFNMALRNGGTLCIDDGRPTPERVTRMAINIAAVRPTWYTNVPLGYSMLLPLLESDMDLAAAFFDRLDLMVYGGASLSSEIWDRFNALFRRIKGRAAPWASGWGLTETTSTVTITPRPVGRAGLIGIPLPGMEVRLEPYREAYLAHVRGPNVTPGYWQDERATAGAFDKDGFFCTGDLVRLADPGDPDAGLEYLGRATEEFKLATGNWVLPGQIRLDIMRRTGPVVADLVVAGAGQDFLTAFLWLNNNELGPLSDGLTHPQASVSSRLLSAVEEYNALNPGATRRLRRICVLAAGPEARLGELTEKGSINHGCFLSNRRALVQAVYRRARLSTGEACECEFEEPVTGT